MIIQCDLSLQDFDVVDFYGTLTCFAWQNKQLVTLPYDSENNKLIKPKKLIPFPNDIKNVVSYIGRVFVICIPSGIYKLSRDYKLGSLSKTGVGLGSAYHSVLIPRDNWLCVDDKLSKISETLFPLSKSELSILVLRSSTTNNKLKVILNPTEPNFDLCLIANGKNLYKLTNKGAQIIYAGETTIVSIITIKEESKDSGIALLTNSQTVVLSQITDDNLLIFKTIIFDFNISSLSLEFIQDSKSKEIFIIYADNEKVNSAKLKFESSAIDNSTIVSNLKIVSLKKRDNKLIGLSSEGKLIELVVDTMAGTSVEMKDYYPINQGMLKCTSLIMDKICERAKELNNINENLLIYKDKLNRVNIYSHKQRISYLPKIQVDKCAGILYLRVKFDTYLPSNSQIVVNFTSQDQKIFTTKKVQGLITNLELPLKDDMIDCDLNINFDLITLSNEDKPWCIIKNCFQELQRGQEKKNTDKSTDKKNFLNAKYDALKKLIDDEKIDMKKLVNIKNSLRKEFPN